MELRHDQSTAFSEYIVGPNKWVYTSWASDDFKCIIQRITACGSSSEYQVTMAGHLPAHEMNVLCGKIQQITNGGRQ